MLRAAAIRGASEDVETLVPFGAEVNITGDPGNTPRYHAASRGNLEIAQTLLRYGGDISVKNEFGQTPADLAILLKHSGLATLLKKRNQRVDPPNMRPSEVEFPEPEA